MNIYTLAYNETHSTDKIFTCLTKEECFDTMISDIEETLSVKIDRSKVENAFAEGKDYKEDGLVIGKTYAQDCGFGHCWEMFTTDIPDYLVGRMMIVGEFFKLFPNCKRFESVVFKMVGEYSDERIERALKEDINIFINDNIVGECLYQHAAAELGGKTDEKSTSTIFEFFNHYKFLQFFNTNFKFDGIDLRGGTKWHDEAPIAHENWVFAMLAICSGDTKVVEDMRNYIDFKYKGDIFFDFGLYKSLLCENHREKSALLNDVQYHDIVRHVIKYEVKKNGETFTDKVDALWNEMVVRIYLIGLEKGFDYLIEHFNSVVEVNYQDWCGVGHYTLEIEKSFNEVAKLLDEFNEESELFKKYEILKNRVEENND